MGGNAMTQDVHQKVKTSHLKRNAYLYVRQSTLRQVFENTESTQRQYALRQHAAALGWPLDRIIVIDTDLGQSGASAADREGFQPLVTEVGLGMHSRSVFGSAELKIELNPRGHRQLPLVEVVPSVKLIFSANPPPPSDDPTHGIFRRWIVAPFSRTFDEASKKHCCVLIFLRRVSRRTRVTFRARLR